MKLEIEIPHYSAEQGVVREWDAGFRIAVDAQNTEVVIRANRAGLMSLARHCLILAQQSVPEGFHFHYDVDLDDLQAGSAELVIERDDFQVAD